ncbi:MAG: hypothetical protein IT385_00895 [Deltaproteobacteria bacterium]|nr:hypothetical protein [Deltaproteobacteria bacterium]
MVPRLPLVALAVLALVAAAPPARSAPDPASRASLTADLRLVLGGGDVAGLDLLVPALGLAWRVAPTLTLRASAIGLAPLGRTRDGREARGGAGGELDLRFAPWPEAPVRPWLHTAIGLLLFPSDPFLPGGDIYEGILTFGLGADVPLSDRLTVSLALDYVHLSNGQGLGPHNPAFDGVGLALGARWSLAPEVALRGAWPDGPPSRRARPGWAPGVIVDAHGGRVDDATLATGRLRLAERLADPLLVLVDVEAGALDGERLVDVGLALVAHLDGALTLALHGGHRDFIGLATPTLLAQLDLHATPELDLVAMVQWERPELEARDLLRVGLGVRAYPFPSLVVELGVGFDRIGARAADGSDPYLGLEWQLPLGADDVALSLFLERQITTVDTVGLRLAWGLGPTPRDAARHAGWRRLR